MFRKERKPSKKKRIELLTRDLDELRESCENQKENNQLLRQIVDKLKGFISSALTNEEKLGEIHSYFTRITEALLTENKPENSKLLDRVLSLDRRMDRWDKDAAQLENMNKLIDDVTRVNTEMDDVINRQHQQIEDFKTCQICFEPYDFSEHHRCIFSNCGHVLCFSCGHKISKSETKLCPTCRRPITAESIIKIFEATLED